MRSPSGSKSGLVMTVAFLISPRISISKAAPSSIISGGRKPSATDFPTQWA